MGHGASAYGAHTFVMPERTYLMNVYPLVHERISYLPSHISATGEQIINVFYKSFLRFFLALINLSVAAALLIPFETAKSEGNIPS